MTRHGKWVRIVGQHAALAFLLIASAACAADVPSLDHVIVIVMENKNLDQVRTLPYTASLVADGASFSDFHAITHPSQPNYFALWSGSTQGVTSNQCKPRGTPWMTENLGHLVETSGQTWRAYVEDLPTPGFTDCSSRIGKYKRKHAPWTNFGNLDHQNERPYSDLGVDIAAGHLPALAFVIPNNNNNTHDQSVSFGDAWLSQNVPAMLQAVGPRGVVVLTWDENDGGGSNQILTTINGALVKPGFVSTGTASHYTLLRTICDALKLQAPGLAARETPITDIWDEAAKGAMGGPLGAHQ